MTTIQVTDKYGKSHSAKFTQNLRFTDFMKVNKYAIDMVNTASDVYALCKQEWTKIVMSNVGKGLLEKAITRPVLTKNGFKFRRQVTYAPALATGSVDEIEAVKGYLLKRVEMADKTRGIVAEFLNEYENEPSEEKAA